MHSTIELIFGQKLESTWSQLHSTQQINDEQPIWLVADPVSLRVQNPSAEADGLRMAMGIDTYLSIRAHLNKPLAPKPEALPNLQVVSSHGGSLQTFGTDSGLC